MSGQLYQPPPNQLFGLGPPAARTPRQWEAHVRAQLRRGVPVQMLVGELVVAGMPPQAAYGYVLGHLSSLRQQVWILVLAAAAVLVLAAFFFLAALWAPPGDTDTSALFQGALVLLVVGLPMAAVGGSRLLRLPRS